MKKTSIILIILLSVFYIGCKRTHCPAWSAEVNYFPYSKSQMLIFTNSQLDTQYFKIERRENSKSESLAWNCHCECAVYSLFTATTTPDIFDIRCDIKVGGADFAKNIAINCTLNFQNYDESQSYKEYLSEQIIPDKKFLYEETSKYLKDTIFLKKENNKMVIKMAIVKNKGLISFTTADGKEWILAE